MDNTYLYILKDKNEKVISSNYCISNITYAKNLLDILMYKTGVRTGKLVDVATKQIIYESEIYHYGE
jgi:hypothetical protein